MTVLVLFLLSALLVQFFYLWVVVDEETDTVECLTLYNYRALELERGYAELGRKVRSTKLAGYLADTYWKGAYDYREATRQSLEPETEREPT